VHNVFAMHELFPWSAQLETGIAKIDVQHRMLVTLLNRLGQQRLNGATEADLQSMLVDLTNYANLHFRSEEALWRSALPQDCGQPEHVLEHQQFQARLMQLSTDTHPLSIRLDELLAYLIGWLIGHILGSDRRMALVVQSVRSGVDVTAARENALQHMSDAAAVMAQTVLSVYQQLSAQTLSLLHERSAHQRTQQSLHDAEDRWRWLIESSDPLTTQAPGQPLFLRAILHHLPAGLAVADAASECIVFANPRFCQMLGYSLDELKSMRAPDLHPTEVEAHVEQDFENSRHHSAETTLTLPVRRKDGSTFLANVSRVPVTLANQRCLLVVFTDQSQQQEAEMALQMERVRLQNAVDAAQAGAWEWDIATNQLRFDARCRSMLGYPGQAVLAVSRARFEALIHPQDLVSYQHNAQAHLQGETVQFDIELRLKHHQGHWCWFHSLGRLIQRDAQGNAQRFSGILVDITEQKTHQAQMEFVTHHDALTGLPNRRLFVETLAAAMTSVAPDHFLAVAYIDLDGFAAVNQQHGEEVGNQLLIALGRRLDSGKGAQQSLAHIGGDEFALLIYNLSQSDHYVEPVRQLLLRIAQPVVLPNVSISVTASIGVTLFPQHESMDAEQLLRQADQAMYAAKQAGKNRHVRFDPEFDEHMRQRMHRQNELRQALRLQQMVLYYQPKVELNTSLVIGFEALIRWNHPQRGLLSPAAFIDLITGGPLAIAAGDWVIESALAQLASWNRQGMTTQVSVNIDAQQLLDPTFTERLCRQLAAQPTVQARQFQVEILETGALNNLALVADVVHQLNVMGVECALDDFGTGYSSLTFLKRLAAHTIKIDQSFVRSMLDDVENAAIVNSVLSLSRNFDRHALAEGVETLEQGRALIEFGCPYGQGFAISRPMPADQVLPWLQRWEVPDYWANSVQAPPRDIPILLAKVEHRAWMRQLHAYLVNPSLPAPINDPTQCRFGKWLLRRSTVKRFQHNAFLDGLHELHHNLHQQTAELMAHVQSNPKTNIQTDLDMIDALSRNMLDQLRTMRLSAADTGWGGSDFGEL